MIVQVILDLFVAFLVIPGYYGSRCGYESCHKPVPGLLNVHLVPHTHDDVGWLKTVDQYYYGSKTSIQKAGVQYILDSVVQELLKDPEKRFIYVESAFFFKWWKEQDEDMKKNVKMLVNEGRLEFTGGAWSMNDEAASHYQSIIDQFALGLKLLNDTFGKCSRPRIGWQIDPFGHSREMASIFAQMKYDGLFFGRLDYEDRLQRLNTKTAEMIWMASPDNLGDSANLFTGALYNQYQPPPGFCFDILCADEPIIDSKHSPDNNVDKRLDEFFQFINEQRKYYKSNNIILTMGGDFTHQDANAYLKNLDKLIRYGNARQANGSDINLLYSTPACYLKSLYDSNLTWPTKTDDFFPYSSDPHAFWTGYFSSRPTSKRYEREGNHFLQICKQLTALAPENTNKEHLNFMKETMGVMQHHDAITGTEKQHVANDYHRRLSVAFRACGTNIKEALNNLSKKDENTKKLGFQFCPALNISLCPITEKENNFIVTVYNPLSFTISYNIRFPVGDGSYQVFDQNKLLVESQRIQIPVEVRSFKFRNSTATNDLIFRAAALPPLGYRSFYVQKTVQSFSRAPEARQIIRKNRSSIVSIENEYIRANFDGNGYLASIEKDGKSTIITQEFQYYKSETGNNREFKNRSSGAYIFRPKDKEASPFGSKVQLSVIKGPLVQEVHQKINNWVSQIIRIHKDCKNLEFEWMVGPIPISDGIGKEIISRFTTEIETDGIFYTDSNGREMIKRKRNHRDTYRLQLKELVAGNYYPVTTRIAIEDNSDRVAVITDRAQGGSSMHDGSFELMLHRRCLYDDAFGVEEALNETAYGRGLIARGKHTLVLGKSRNTKLNVQEKISQVISTLPPHPFFSPIELSLEEWSQNYVNNFSGLNENLDFPATLLTLEPWNKGELLVRFEHNLEKFDQRTDVLQFNIKQLLAHFKINGVRETTLDGSQWLGEYKRLEFVPEPEGTEYKVLPRSKRFNLIPSAKRSMIKSEYEVFDDIEFNYLTSKIENNEKRFVYKSMPIQNSMEILEEDEFNIQLQPMQIRTFVVYYEE